MEGILSKLLISDNKVIQEGTKELREALKTPESIMALCDVAVSSSHPLIRQSAAVVLRRRLGKKKHWNKIDVNTRNQIKQGLLRALISEQEKLVKNSIAQLVGLIGKYEFPDNTWPEVLQFVHTLCNSDNALDKELGMYTLSIMTEISQGSYLPHAEAFAVLFMNILNGLQDLTSNLAYYCVITMNNLVAVIGGHQQMINVYHGLLPRVLEVINAFCQMNEKKACDMFEILENLIEYAVAVIVPHIRLIVDMCLQTGKNNDLPTSIQIKAIGVVGWLIRSKGKVIQKHKLVEPIIDVLIQLMAQQPDDEGNEEYFLGDPDQCTTITIATQTLDLIALHVPAEKVVPYLLTKVEPAIQSNNVYSQKAAYLALAVLAEGCAEKIRRKYLESFLKCVCGAIHNPNAVVRNAALFALGQFAEHLQPEISQYSSELLPVLFECLKGIFSQMEQERTDPPSLDRLFYALETFCANLDDALLPYLPTLMERLFVALEPTGFSFQLKRVALSTLGSAACAVKQNMMPYFPKIIEILRLYINASPESELHELQSYAIEALAVVAQFIGAENFKPLAPESLQFGMKILTETLDPDVKKSVYALFAALATVMKEEMSPALEKIIEYLICTLQSSEGITATYEDEDKEEIDVYGNLSDSSSEEEDIEGESSASSDSTQCRYSVENAYNEEKEQACLTLKVICENTGTAFLPYLEKSFEEVWKLINYPQDDIRVAAVEALTQFCVSLAKIDTQETKIALYKGLQMLIPKCAELIRSDEERVVVTCCLNAYGTLLSEVGRDVLVGEGHREAIMNCVIDVLTLKTVCQDTDLPVAAETNEEDEEAEQDEALLESAGDVIPKFAAAITPDDFALYFPNVLKLLAKRTMKQNSVSQRSFAFGTLAECMKPLDVYVEKFVPQLMHLWLMGSKDSSAEVRNNSVYGLGEMILYGKDCVFPYFNQILQALSVAISKESHAGTLDNICGAIAKMIIVNSNNVPLDQVFPVLLKYLPLKEDLQENEAVVKCFVHLYQQGNPAIRQHLSDVIQISAKICAQDQTPNDETKQILVEFLKMMSRDFNEEFMRTISSMDPEMSKQFLSN